MRDASTLIFFCVQLLEPDFILDLKQLWLWFILIDLPNILDIVHRLRLKIPQSFGDWICLRLRVVKGDVQPAEKVTQFAIHLYRKLVHSNIKSVPSTRVEQSRFFLYPFHLSMGSVHNFSHNYYWFYTFLGWNWSLLCGTELTTQRFCRQGYTSFNRIQKPPQTTRHQKPDIKQIPYCGPSNIWRHRTKFSHSGHLTPWTCAPQLTTVFLCLWFEITEQVPDWLRAGQPGIDFWQGLGIWAVILRPVLIPNQCPIQWVSLLLGYSGRSVNPDLSSA